jgi:hypothetical protein
MGEELRKPLGSYVLIKNPLTREMFGKEKELLEKLPEDQREEYMKAHYDSLWDGVEILAIGPDVRGLKVGDKAVTNGMLVSNGTYTQKDTYILVREGQFVAVW